MSTLNPNLSKVPKRNFIAYLKSLDWFGRIWFSAFFMYASGSAAMFIVLLLSEFSDYGLNKEHPFLLFIYKYHSFILFAFLATTLIYSKLSAMAMHRMLGDLVAQSDRNYKMFAEEKKGVIDTLTDAQKLNSDSKTTLKKVEELSNKMKA